MLLKPISNFLEEHTCSFYLAFPLQDNLFCVVQLDKSLVSGCWYKHNAFPLALKASFALYYRKHQSEDTAWEREWCTILY